MFRREREEERRERERRRERMRVAVVDYFERRSMERGTVAVWEVREDTERENTALVFFDNKVAAVSEGWRVVGLQEGRAFVYSPCNSVYGNPRAGEACLMVVLVAYGGYQAKDMEAVPNAIQRLIGSPVACFSMESEEHGNIGGYACEIAFDRDTPAVIFREFYSWNYILSIEIISLEEF